MTVTLCRVTGEPLTKVLDLGRQPLGNGFLNLDQFVEEYFFPLEIGFSERSMMFQLIEQPAPEKMFHDQYAFYSSTSNYMAQHFKQFAQYIETAGYLSGKEAFVVELGCNDGILLRNFAQQGIRHLGIEPSSNVAQEANKQGVNTITEFFSADLADAIISDYGQADVFLAANVMCHIPDILGVVRGIKTLLKPTGVVVFEDPYLGDVISKTSYDQIYDEHVFLFSALSIQYLFALHGMDLIDVLPQTTHGGSMRYVVCHKGAYEISTAVHKLLAKERNAGLDRLETFIEFSQRVAESRADLVGLIKELKSHGKRVVGYAATSKSTTILNYCGIGPNMIEYICDTTPIKQGKFSPGMHIPIVSYETFKDDLPDYAVLLAWNHANEIMAKEKRYLSAGGKWIVHVPQVRVL